MERKGSGRLRRLLRVVAGCCGGPGPECRQIWSQVPDKCAMIIRICICNSYLWICNSTMRASCTCNYSILWCVSW